MDVENAVVAVESYFYVAVVFFVFKDGGLVVCEDVVGGIEWVVRVCCFGGVGAVAVVVFDDADGVSGFKFCGVVIGVDEAVVEGLEGGGGFRQESSVYRDFQHVCEELALDPGDVEAVVYGVAEA